MEQTSYGLVMCWTLPVSYSKLKKEISGALLLDDVGCYADVSSLRVGTNWWYG